MSAELHAEFEKRFPRGPVIRACLRHEADRFSIAVLIGPSGCGKTTILRCLAGLERPEIGTIRFGAETWLDATRGVCLRPQQRGIGYLFQEYALFPHKTVEANVSYGLAHAAVSQRQRATAEMLDRFGLVGLERRYPRELSGGQQQRVALARVLARRPRLVLLDEPLSALDASMREELRGELRSVLAEFGVPVVLVTHERVEAIALADRIVVLDQGTVRQTGTVEEVFNRPADLATARIVGVETVHAGRIIRNADGLATVSIAGRELVAVAPAHASGEVFVCIRAEEVALQPAAAVHTSVRNQLPACVTSLSPEGPLVRVGLDCGFSLTAIVTRPACAELALGEGARVVAQLKAPAIHLILRG